MKRLALYLLPLTLLASVPQLWAKNEPLSFKYIVVQHFANPNGINFPAIFINGYCDTLRDWLLEFHAASQVVEDAAAVPAADAPNSLVIEGRFTAAHKGGFSSPGDVEGEVSIYRLSDHALVKTTAFKGTYSNAPEKLTVDRGIRFSSRFVANQIMVVLKTVNLASIPSAPPGSAPASPAAAGAPGASALPAPAAMASVQFSSIPDGAEISIDGNYVGNVPSLIKVKPGTHSIQLTKTGYQPWVRFIAVAAGESRTIAAELDPVKP